MVDDDLAQRADGIVEVATILDAKSSANVMWTLDVVAIPHGLQNPVGEAQEDDLLETHLAEVMIDPIQLGLVHVLVQFLRKRAGGRAVVAEGFSTTIRPESVSPASASPLMTVANRNGGISR
jgi:hypothetical protein